MNQNPEQIARQGKPTGDSAAEQTAKVVGTARELSTQGAAAMPNATPAQNTTGLRTSRELSVRGAAGVLGQRGMGAQGTANNTTRQLPQRKKKSIGKFRLFRRFHIFHNILRAQ